MVTCEKIVEAGHLLARAHDLLVRANDIVFPSTPQLTTKQGLLDEARRCVRVAHGLLAE
jgi:hypothetical protein